MEFPSAQLTLVFLLTHSPITTTFRAVCRNFATGRRTWGILKKRGRDAAVSSVVRGSTGRQCLKISLVILREGEIDTGGGGGGKCPLSPPKYTPDVINIVNSIALARRVCNHMPRAQFCLNKPNTCVANTLQGSSQKKIKEGGGGGGGGGCMHICGFSEIFPQKGVGGEGLPLSFLLWLDPCIINGSTKGL